MIFLKRDIINENIIKNNPKAIKKNILPTYKNQTFFPNKTRMKIQMLFKEKKLLIINYSMNKIEIIIIMIMMIRKKVK